MKDFWKLIESSKDGSSCISDQIGFLKEWMKSASIEEVEAFDTLVRGTLYPEASTNKLWFLIAFIFDRNYLPDSRFDRFRTWLILQGEEHYRRIIAEPDLIAEYELDLEVEDLRELSRAVYEERSGKKNEHLDSLEDILIDACDSKEEEDQFIEQAPQMFPRLHSRMRLHELRWHPKEVSLMLALQNGGCKLDEVHDSDHFFLSKSQAQAESLAARLIELGYEASTDEAEADEVSDEYKFYVAALEQSSPQSVAERAQRLYDLAEELECVYDGWGTSY